MHTLFRVLLRSAPRSLLLLFLIVTFAATGVLVIRQLVENVQRSISVEMRPYLGGDIRISANATFTGSIRESIQEILPQKEGYDFAEKVEFYTTAFDTSGKSELIRVIAVNSGYPLYSVYRTSQI
jgi:predicted lysophospholipase L1 biosynthesis ABC-type transport system permease subunit